MVQCTLCESQRASIKRPKTGEAICRECFFKVFEKEIHETIISNALFKPGQRVAIGASGGKDSTVLAYVLQLLNKRHDYGLDLILLSVDEGIQGYRDDSLEAVRRHAAQFELPLTIVSYKDLYQGWTMDRVVQEIGRRGNCTYCGVFRRQALDRAAEQAKADHLVTGHNADDMAETVLMNLLRGDIARLGRCTSITTGGRPLDDQPQNVLTMPRSKPLKYTYEKEIVMYAYMKQLDYFSTECKYSPDAYRGFARHYLKDLERLRPSSILDIIHAGEALALRDTVKEKLPVQVQCTVCGHMASNTVCKACTLLVSLNRGLAKISLEDETHPAKSEEPKPLHVQVDF